MIYLWLILFGEYECGSNQKAKLLHEYWVNIDGNIIVSNTKLKYLPREPRD